MRCFGWIRPAAVAAAFVASIAAGDDIQGGNRVQTKTGTVTGVDVVRRQLTVMVTRELAFTITDETLIVQEGAERRLADIGKGATVTVVYSFAAERTRVASEITVAAPATAPFEGRTDATPPSALQPGRSVTIRFPDLPPTFAELVDAKGIEPQMTVFLPVNYDPARKHPLLVFLNGGTGGRGGNPAVARALSEDRDFVCVQPPLFHKAAPDTPGYDIIIRAADAEYMWPFHKRMLAELERVVPNIDPTCRIIGGFSNGAHAVQEFLDLPDGEAATLFTAYFLVNGGGRLQRYDRLEGTPLLVAYGATALRPQRLAEIVAAAETGGARLTAYGMAGVGHAFPEKEYPAVRAWLRGPAAGRVD